MTQFLSARLVGKTELIQRLDEMPSTVVAMLMQKVTALSIALQAHIVRDKLSGQVLNRVSGKLSRSIQEVVTQSGQSVIGRVFSAGDVKYAAIHEFGGQTSPHDIYPKKADALAFVMGGKTVFAKVVHHPGSKIPERSFMRSALADMREEIVNGIAQAAKGGARKVLRAIG